MTSKKAIGKKSRKVKSVKGIAIIDQHGRIRGVSRHGRFDAFLDTGPKAPYTEESAKRMGWKFIRVSISPL